MNIAKLTTDGTHQTLTLPIGFHLSGNEFYIKKVGNTIVLISTDNPWQSLFESLDKFSDDFLTTREQPPLDIREDF